MAQVVLDRSVGDAVCAVRLVEAIVEKCKDFCGFVAISHFVEVQVVAECRQVLAEGILVQSRRGVGCQVVFRPGMD